MATRRHCLRPAPAYLFGPLHGEPILASIKLSLEKYSGPFERKTKLDLRRRKHSESANLRQGKNRHANKCDLFWLKSTTQSLCTRFMSLAFVFSRIHYLFNSSLVSARCCSPVAQRGTTVCIFKVRARAKSPNL